MNSVINRSAYILLFCFVLTLILNSCKSDCEDEICPSECVNVSLAFFKNGINLFEKYPNTFTNQNIKISANDIDFDPSSSLRVGVSSINFAACKDSEYNLNLADSAYLIIKIQIGISEVLSKNKCCTYYSTSQLMINDAILCSDLISCEETQIYNL